MEIRKYLTVAGIAILIGTGTAEAQAREPGHHHEPNGLETACRIVRLVTDVLRPAPPVVVTPPPVVPPPAVGVTPPPPATGTTTSSEATPCPAPEMVKRAACRIIRRSSDPGTFLDDAGTPAGTSRCGSGTAG